jgi:hypothetical protein
VKGKKEKKKKKKKKEGISQTPRGVNMLHAFVLFYFPHHLTPNTRIIYIYIYDIILSYNRYKPGVTMLNGKNSHVPIF